MCKYINSLMNPRTYIINLDIKFQMTIIELINQMWLLVVTFNHYNYGTVNNNKNIQNILDN